MSGIFSGTIEALVVDILVNMLCGARGSPPIDPTCEPLWVPFLTLGNCIIRQLIIQTLQEYLCIKSIQALAKQPEMIS